MTRAQEKREQHANYRQAVNRFKKRMKKTDVLPAEKDRRLAQRKAQEQGPKRVLLIGPGVRRWETRGGKSGTGVQGR